MNSDEHSPCSTVSLKTIATAFLPTVLKMVAADPSMQMGGLKLISGQVVYMAELDLKLLNEEGEDVRTGACIMAYPQNKVAQVAWKEDFVRN